MKRLMMFAAAAVIAVMLVPVEAFSDEAPKRKRGYSSVNRVATVVRPRVIRPVVVAPTYVRPALWQPGLGYPVAAGVVSAGYDGYRYSYGNDYSYRDYGYRGDACMATNGYQWFNVCAQQSYRNWW
jgi:hypothetical protein